MNWLEDGTHFDRAHSTLDNAGVLARKYFPEGCALEYSDGTYWMSCPVALAHNRIGMSVGVVIRAAECSICGSDPEDCPHIRGRTYNGRMCVLRITDAEILEILLVGRPAMPDARIHRITVDQADLHAALGSDFRRGIPVTCDRCLEACTGVPRPFESVERHNLQLT
jgi:hypothetical protein